MTDASYVSNAAWVRQVGRPDSIDDVADQFERPAAEGRTAFWTAGAEVRWPRAPRGWRSLERLRPGAIERRAG